MRSISCGVMPATGSSTSSNSGFCISSMPISSHCFWPCARILPSAPRCSDEADDFENLVDSLVLRGRNAGAQRFQERPVAGQRQFQVLEHRQLLEHGRLLKFPADSGCHDFRLRQLKQIDVARQTTPFPNPDAFCR